MMDEQIEEDYNNLIKSRRSSKADVSGGKNINMGYLMGLILTVALATVNFGYQIGIWNVSYAPYEAIHDWGDTKESKQAFVQTMMGVGGAFGALFIGPIMYLGKWRCLMLTNVFLIVSAGLSLVENYPIFVFARTFYGFSTGMFSVLVPKYIAETAPIEVKGMAGGVVQAALTFGILISFCIGIAVPADSLD